MCGWGTRGQGQPFPDGCSYNILARLYAASSSQEDAAALADVLARARRRGVAEPELYHALMSAHARRGDLPAVVAILERMLADGTGTLATRKRPTAACIVDANTW